MDFGVFDHLDRSHLPLREYYEARLKLIEAYDRAGFYSYHLAEHHSTPLGMAPSPSVFLAAAAQRTRQLRLGTMVYALPLHHPLRLVEEICMLDHLSGGRIDMGFGRGSSPIELEYYGQDPEDAPRVYAEAMDVVLRALTQKTLTAATRTHRFDDVPMELAPLQQPHPPLWYGVHSPESAERAARMGSNIACNEPAEASADLHRALLVGLARAPGRPRAAAESRRHPFRRGGRGRRRGARDCAPRLSGLAQELPSPVPPPRPGGEDLRRRSDFDELAARGKGVAGRPEKVVRFLQERLGRTGANYCINRFAFGDLTLAESLRSVELFVSHVRPALLALQEEPGEVQATSLTGRK